jgi:RNA polymerase sigma factor (sigma-70 family)
MLAVTKEFQLTALPHSSRDHLWSPAQRARVVRLCTAVVGDAAAAEDLAQETLLEAWRHQHRLTDPSGADAWLNAIARNVCRRWLRARGSAAVPTADDGVLEGASEARDLDHVLEREELVELLDRALGLLPDATRAALVGHYVDELSHAEIAQRLGTSADAVSMRVSRGRSRLRYLLETRFADDALAAGWARRDATGWHATRLRCPDCARAGIEMRHDDAEVAFRCRTCDADGLSVRLPLDAPAFGALVGDVRRPSAIQARVAAWTQSYWSSSAPRCVRCDHAVTPQPYTRDEVERWSTRHGWYASCDACGQEVSGSVAGLALALPEVRAARRHDPRLRALPVRDVVRDGRDAKVVGFGTVDGTPVVSAVFLADSLRLAHIG